MDQTNLSYLAALKQLCAAPTVVRRGMRTKELVDYTFLPMDPQHRVITIPGFETDEEYADLEFQFYLSKTNDLDFHPRIRKTLARFSDDDKTANSAYGYRIFGKDPRINIDQFRWCIEELQQDPWSRRAVININMPYDKKHDTKDMPCTMFLQFMTREDRKVKTLDMFTYMRSNDIYLGTRNDIYCFMSFHRLMRSKLTDCGFVLGQYRHHAASLHIYERHFTKLEKIRNL